MSQYDTIDALILSAILSRKSPLYELNVNAEASRLASNTGRKAFRIIDGRMTALKKSGRIEFRRGEPKGPRQWGVIGEGQ